MIATPELKEEIYQAAADEFERKYHNPEFKGGNCVHWSLCAARVLNRYGFKPIIQGGTLQWPMVTEEEDDKVTMSHMGYVWSPNNQISLAAMAAGYMPEMHVWLGLLDTQEIIDFSTGNFSKWALAHNLPWRMPPSPKYLWGKPPPWTVYEAIEEATVLAFQLMQTVINSERIVPVIAI